MGDTLDQIAESGEGDQPYGGIDIEKLRREIEADNLTKPELLTICSTLGLNCVERAHKAETAKIIVDYVNGELGENAEIEPTPSGDSDSDTPTMPTQVDSEREKASGPNNAPFDPGFGFTPAGRSKEQDTGPRMVKHGRWWRNPVSGNRIAWGENESVDNVQYAYDSVAEKVVEVR
jgi:hypothetical protein